MATINDVIECLKELHWAIHLPHEREVAFYEETKERLKENFFEGWKIRLPEYRVYFMSNGKINHRKSVIVEMCDITKCSKQKLKCCLATQRLLNDGLPADKAVKLSKYLIAKYNKEHPSEVSDEYYEV